MGSEREIEKLGHFSTKFKLEKAQWNVEQLAIFIIWSGML